MDIPEYHDNIVNWLESFADSNSNVIIIMEDDEDGRGKDIWTRRTFKESCR